MMIFMPPIILPQAFFHAPNTFKPVGHTDAMNNTSSKVLNFKNVVYSRRSCPKTHALCLSFIAKSFLPLHFRTLSPNPSFISKSFFYHYISVHCPKTQALSLKVFTITFPYIVPKPEQSRASFTIIIGAPNYPPMYEHDSKT